MFQSRQSKPMIRNHGLDFLTALSTSARTLGSFKSWCGPCSTSIRCSEFSPYRCAIVVNMEDPLKSSKMSIIGGGRSETEAREWYRCWIQPHSSRRLSSKCVGVVDCLPIVGLVLLWVYHGWATIPCRANLRRSCWCAIR